MTVVNILGTTVNSSAKTNILEKIEKYLKISKIESQKSKIKREKALVIFTPNPEIIVYAHKHPYFREVVNTAQINIPDGLGVVLASRFLKYPIAETITGVDLFGDIVDMACKNAVKIGLIGGKSKVALKALECLQARYPGLDGIAEEGPRINFQFPISNFQKKTEAVVVDYGGWSMEEFVERVKREEVRVLFVGFGHPKQELFINELAKRLDGTILMAVGGSFDYIAGVISRAPVVMRKLGLEWFYRLVRQPWRIRRQMALIQFVWLVIKKKFKIISNEAIFI